MSYLDKDLKGNVSLPTGYRVECLDGSQAIVIGQTEIGHLVAGLTGGKNKYVHFDQDDIEQSLIRIIETEESEIPQLQEDQEEVLDNIAEVLFKHLLTQPASEFYNPEADEIDEEDLEAAAEMYRDLKSL